MSWLRAAGRGGVKQAAQAAAWKAYIAWERSNMQRLDGPLLAARVSLAYEQALMHLWHFPEVGTYALACYRSTFRFNKQQMQLLLVYHAGNVCRF